MDGAGSLLHQALLVLVSVGGPVVAALLAIGLVVGVLQAATQINDPAVGFLPRLTVLLLVIWVLGGWIGERLATFFTISVQAIATAGH